MASNKNALAMCDTCGFVYPHRVMRLNSYHPQNKVPDVRDNPAIRDPRPDDGGRGITWQQATTKWEDTDNWWNTI